jgi:peptidyl-prolyl cis-trans isomerase B (cyclophilin B)
MKRKENNMANPMVLMETSLGDMLIELYEDKAPETVANFSTDS